MRLLLIVVFVSLVTGCRSTETLFRSQAVASNQSTHQTQREVLAPSPNQYTIEDLVQLGLASSPKIREAEHRINALRSRIPQALALPDPTLNTTTHLSPVETAAGRQAFALGISQKFVNMDRRATRASIAHQETQEAEASLIATQQEVAEQIRVVCYQILAIQMIIQITQDDLASLAQIEEAVLKQYEVNQSVSQQDVLQIQLENSQVENELAELRQKERSRYARLARLLHLEAGSQFVISDSLQTHAEIGLTQDLVAKALESHPSLSAQYSRIARDRQKIALASLQDRPDFTVGFNWIATSEDGISPVANGDDALLLGIGLNLPIRKDRISAARCEAKESSLASEAKLETIEDEIAEAIFDTAAKLESNESTLELLRDDIIPKAERTFELNLEEYKTGDLNYISLIGSWRALLKYRIGLTQLQSQRMQLLANLSRQLGQIESLVKSEPTVTKRTPTLPQQLDSNAGPIIAAPAIEPPIEEK